MSRMSQAAKATTIAQPRAWSCRIAAGMPPPAGGPKPGTPGVYDGWSRNPGSQLREPMPSYSPGLTARGASPCRFTPRGRLWAGQNLSGP
jgi:hypothetical protein